MFFVWSCDVEVRVGCRNLGGVVGFFFRDGVLGVYLEEKVCVEF